MSWKKVKLSELLLQVKTIVQVDNCKEYKLVTISSKGTIKQREVVKGIEIKGEKAFEAKKGRFIYSRLSVHNGAFGIVPLELDGALLTSEMPIFEIGDRILAEFLIYSLRLPTFKFQLEQLTKGVGRTRVKEANFLNLLIDLPEKTEQKEIIKKLSLAENQCGEINSELKYQLSLVKKLRQQLLQDAVRGKLVEQNKNDDPASELLKKIKAEKEKLIAEKKLKKEKELPPIKPEEIPFVIPENWVWCRLGEIAYITSGSTPAQTAFVESGIPYLKMYNLRNQKIDFFHKPQYIKEEVHNGQLKRCRAYSGDIIMNIVGPPLGKIAIIPEDLPECNFNQAAVLIRPLIKEMNQFIFWYLNELSEIRAIETKGVAGQDNISVSQAHNMRVPLPPFSEQNRIVQKLDELMQNCNELEASIKQSESQNEKLLQQVLREALRIEPVES